MAEASKDQTAPLEKGPLLIVGDQPESREILVLLCEKTGHLPTTAESGEVALEMARAREFELEKIKAIGDTYRAVPGVPERCHGHAERAADVALAMRDEIQAYNGATGHSLKARIGMHSGPVVAGMIGTHKFTYDLWGAS